MDSVFRRVEVSSGLVAARSWGAAQRVPLEHGQGLQPQEGKGQRYKGWLITASHERGSPRLQ